MKYEKPEAKVILFDNSDVITTSGKGPECTGQMVDSFCPGPHVGSAKQWNS